MREVDVKKVTEAVAKCCMDSCYYLPEGVLARLKAGQKTEVSPLGRQVLGTIIENAELAKKKAVPCARILV
jgi:fumarate hydratase subunit alpha